MLTPRKDGGALDLSKQQGAQLRGGLTPDPGTKKTPPGHGGSDGKHNISTKIWQKLQKIKCRSPRS